MLLISFASGGFQLWHLYTLSAIQAIFGVFQGPALQASITMLVPDDQRDRTNAIQQLAGPLAGIIAPGVAAGVFAVAGVEGAILLDLFTFFIATAALFLVHIPRPTLTAEGQAMQGSIWQEMKGGLRYLWQRKPIFYMMMYVSLVNFFVGGVMQLMTPYVLARTGNDELALGVILSLLNIGGLIGGIIIGVWGGTRPRMYTILPALLISGVYLTFAGMSQNPIVIGIMVFLFMLPLPMVNAPFISILQRKVAPDVQGRVFAVLGQMSLLLTPLAYLIVGPLADQVFEPAVNTGGWAAFAPFVGSGFGSGMGLMFVRAGLVVVVSTLVIAAIPMIRNMEALLPDYVPEAPPEPITTEDVDVIPTSDGATA